jgi:hypothetical protein
MFEPTLRLIPEMDGQFSLLAETEVPNSFYTAGKAKRGAPKALTVGAHVTAVTLPLKYKEKSTAGDPRVVFHRVFDLDVTAGAVLKAYLTLDDRLLGEASTVVASRMNVLVGASIRSFGAGAGMRSVDEEVTFTDVELTIQLCEAIVVESAPRPENFTDVTQQLRELGVIDDSRARFHKDRIRRRLAQHGFVIETQDIESGPAIQVDACADSVFQNASV